MSERLKKLIGDELYEKVTAAAAAGNVKVKDIDIIPNNFVTKNRFDEINGELKTSKEKIVTYENNDKNVKKLLKNLNAENVDDITTKFTNMTNSHKNELEKKDSEIFNIKKTGLFKDDLVTAGAKYTQPLLKMVDLDKLQIENDKLIGSSDVIKDLKTEYPGMFVEKKSNGKPPKDTNNKDGEGGEGGEGGSGEPGIDIFDSLLKGTTY